MRADGNEIYFSVIVPTRDREKLFSDALRSVIAQTFGRKEIIVVNDGSTEPHLSNYKELERQFPDVTFHYLVHRPNGHGQSYSMNYGVSQASGDYVCFLDDDDFWTDEKYLEKLYESISSTDRTVDVHYSNQKAFFSNGAQQAKNVWIEDLSEKLERFSKDYAGAYLVDVDFMLSSKGFAHLNCSAFRREFYESIGGMDEGIRYECDRDIYIRSIDAAETVLLNPNYMSHHNVPDANKKDNMSTLISNLEKKLYQLRVYEKAILLCSRAVVVDYCMRARNYQLKHVATFLKENGEFKKSFYYAREVLLIGFNLRWLAYTLGVGFQSLFGRN